MEKFDGPFGEDELVYDVNKELSQWAFPGKMRAFVENADQVVDTQGMTKREYYSLKFACALASEYVRKPGSYVIELINQQAIRMADDLIHQLSNSVTGSTSE